MSQYNLSITLLIDPTSSKNGKFYLGIDDDRFPMTAHGPASQGATGTWVKVSNSQTVRKKVNEKQNKAYRAAALSEIPPKVIERLYEKIADALSVPASSLGISNGFVVMNGTGSTASKPRKPRRRNSQSINVWI
tara:strand:- start:263 stop:664 length:402 start_codon:yes stop_codon:yes gene_type:complete